MTGCTDTAFAQVLCFECPPLVDYPVNIGGNIVWTTGQCDADTVFCTKIPGSELGKYTITVTIADALLVKRRD